MIGPIEVLKNRRCVVDGALLGENENAIEQFL
jgi:hypothetical protein